MRAPGRRTQTRLVLLNLLLLVVVVAMGCQLRPSTGSSTVMTVDVGNEPPTLDPEASASAATFYITASVAESLLYLDQQHNVEPWLAETWEIGDGGASFTFHLRRDVTFQDGTPFNASAVKWNFDRVVDPNYSVGAALDRLFGYQGTDVLDEYTARVHFAQPFMPFLVYAGTPQLAMLSPTATAAAGAGVNQAPVGSGPYRAAEWLPRDHVTLERWDGYKRRAPWSDHDGPGRAAAVIWKFVPEPTTRGAALESGEAQLVQLSTPQDVAHARSAGMQISSIAQTGAPETMFLNVTQPPTDDVQVRRAILAAIDRDAIAANMYQDIGTPAIGPMTANLLDDPALRTIRPYDPARARQLLDEDEWRPGEDGIRAKSGQRLSVVVNASASAVAPYELVQAELRDVGIELNIKRQALGAYQDEAHRCQDNALFNYGLTPDLDQLRGLFHSTNIGTNNNWSCLRNPDFDRSLDQAREEVDPAKRRQLYLQMEQWLLDMAAEVPLVDQLTVFGVRPNVSGFKFTGSTYPLLSDLTITQ